MLSIFLLLLLVNIFSILTPLLTISYAIIFISKLRFT